MKFFVFSNRPGRSFSRLLGFAMGLSAGLLAPQVSAQLVLNEIMANNVTALANEDEFPDWVEICHTGSNAVSLAGWSLTDDLSNPAKYVFPAGLTLQPGQCLVVYCDDSDDLPGLHSGFGLSDQGEAVALYSPANPFAPHDAVSFGLQVADYSIGRVPDRVGGWTLTLATPMAPNEASALGTYADLFINEWMADNGEDDDWLELYNNGDEPVNLSGLVFSDDVGGSPGNRALPNLSFIGGQGFIQFIADNLDNDDADHLDFRLSSGGETLSLYQPNRLTLVDRVSFGAQTEGVSQGRLPDGALTFVFFPEGRATPESSNFLPLTNVVVNELLSHTDPPLEDAIELVNLSSAPVDISYWWLSDSRSDVQKYQIPPGTIIPPGGYWVVYEADLDPLGTGEFPGFALNSSQGEEVYLHTANAQGNLTGFRNNVEFPAAENGVSLGRYTDSLGRLQFVPLRRHTFGVENPATLEAFRQGTGAPNALPRVGPVVFNEIMYHPPETGAQGDNTDDEYLELLNISREPVLLYDPEFPTNRWRIEGGVEFEFQAGTTIPAGSALLVVNFNPVSNPGQLTVFRQRYGLPPGVPIYGPYSGNLDNREERLELNRPDKPQGPDRDDAGFVPYLTVDWVEYEDRDPWPPEPDEMGPALAKIDPGAFGNDPVNWRAATPSPGPAAAARFVGIALVDGDAVLEVETEPYRSYSVQYRSLVDSGPWTKLQDVYGPANGGVVAVTDPAAGGETSRYYRVTTPAVE